MQAVILAAGKGSRMKEHTELRPKPMLIVAGRPLLERKIESLPKEIDEVIVVVGYLKEQIISHFGSSYAGKKMTYVVAEPLGTGFALWQARPYLKDEFIVMMGDDMYGSDDIAELMKHQWAMEAIPSPGFQTAADIKMDERGYFLGADFDYEGQKETIMLDTGIYMMNKDIFNIELVQLRNGEYGLPHTLFKYIKDTNTPLFVHKAKHWIKMNNPGDLEKAEEYYSAGI